MRSFKLHLSWPIVLLAAAAITVISGGHVVHAGDPAAEGAQEAYLVKLPQGQRDGLVQWVKARGGSVLDVRTMQDLTRDPVAPTTVPEPLPTQPTAPQTRPTDPNSVPRLASGLETYKALLSALEAAGSGETATDPGALRLERVTIKERRIHVRVRVRNVELLDRVRSALEAQPVLRARSADGRDRVERGTLSRLPDDSVRSDFVLHFESAFRGRSAEAGDAQKVDALADARVHAASAAAGARMLQASAIRLAPNRKLGISLRSREYTFDTASLQQLIALIKGLEVGTGAVTEVRYELLPPKQQVPGKSPRTGRVQIRLTQVVPLGD